MSSNEGAKKCRSLYKKYKNTCEDVNVYQQCPIKPIMEMTIQELDEYIKEMTIKFNKTKKCYNERYKHRIKCISEEEYDKGHDKQFTLLEQQLNLCENIIEKGYERLEKELEKLNEIQEKLQKLDRKSKNIRENENSKTDEKLLVKSSPRIEQKSVPSKKKTANIPKASKKSIIDILDAENKLYNVKHQSLVKEIELKIDHIRDIFLNKYKDVLSRIYVDNENLYKELNGLINIFVYNDILLYNSIKSIDPLLVINRKNDLLSKKITLFDLIDQGLNNKQLELLSNKLSSFNDFSPFYNYINNYITDYLF